MSAVYAALAEVYDFLVPEALLSPEGSAAAFEDVLTGVERARASSTARAGRGRSRSGSRSAASRSPRQTQPGDGGPHPAR